MKCLSVSFFSLIVWGDVGNQHASDPSPQQISPRSVIHSRPDRQSSPSVSKFLAEFARMPGLQADFREEKRMALLAAPLINEGTVHFAREKLVRHTIRPSRSSVLVSKGKLEFFDGTERKSLDVNSHPLLRHFVETFAMILGGNYSGLAEIYQIRFSGNRESWVLELQPNNAEIAKTISKISLKGEELILAEMKISEAGGDSTTMKFFNVSINRKYSEKEMRKIFRVEPFSRPQPVLGAQPAQ